MTNRHFEFHKNYSLSRAIKVLSISSAWAINLFAISRNDSAKQCDSSSEKLRSLSHTVAPWSFWENHPWVLPKYCFARAVLFISPSKSRNAVKIAPSLKDIVSSLCFSANSGLWNFCFPKYIFFVNLPPSLTRGWFYNRFTISWSSPLIWATLLWLLSFSIISSKLWMIATICFILSSFKSYYTSFLLMG